MMICPCLAIAELYRDGAEVGMENHPEGVVIRARMDRREAGRYAQYVIESRQQ